MEYLALLYIRWYLIYLNIGFFINFREIDEWDNSNVLVIEKDILAVEDTLVGLLRSRKRDNDPFEDIGVGVNFILDQDNLADVAELLDEVVS